MKGILESRFSGVPDLWIKVFLSEFNSTGMSARNVIRLLEYATRVYANKNGSAGKLTQKEIKHLLLSLSKDICLDDKARNERLDDNITKGKDKNAFPTTDNREDTVH